MQYTELEESIYVDSVRCQYAEQYDCQVFPAGHWPEYWWEDDESEEESEGWDDYDDEVWCINCNDAEDCEEGAYTPTYNKWLCTDCIWSLQYVDMGEEEEHAVVHIGTEQANAERNKRSIERLRETFKSYCSHHLFYRHVKGRKEACKYGDDRACERGSHLLPDGFNPSSFA